MSAAVTAVAARSEYTTRFDRQSAQIEAVAQLRAAQASSWLNNRAAAARFALSSDLYASLYLRARDENDLASARRLRERLAELSAAFGNARVLLLDADGRQLDETGTPTQLTAPALRDAATRAMASGEVVQAELHQSTDDGEPHVWHDIVAPLVRTGTPAQAAVAFRQDARPQLLTTLQTWPVPSRTGTTVSFKADVDIFSRVEYSYDTLSQRLREIAYLNPGLRIVVTDAEGRSGVALKKVSVHDDPTLRSWPSPGVSISSARAAVGNSEAASG